MDLHSYTDAELIAEFAEIVEADEDFDGFEIHDEIMTYTARTSGKTYKANPDKGDGYWCSTHEGGCRRSCEDRRWGKFGAAGILFYHRETQTFLMNQRSKAIHFGGTWSTLGGAIDRNESPLDGAMREAEEEIGAVPPPTTVIAEHVSVTQGNASDWVYTTFVIEVGEQWTPEAGDWESMGNEWVTLNEMATLPLHAGFKASITELLAEMYYNGAFQR